MKFEAPRNIPRSVFLLPFTLLLTAVLLHLISNLNQSSSPKIYATNLDTTGTRGKCNIFSGHWAPYPKGTYYSNDTCPHMVDQLNCLRFGRPDTEFLKLRWKPHECELPMFDATQFLELVRGKSMAFLGDSMGRNQMESLLCLLNNVANNIEDVTGRYTSNEEPFFRWWFSANYNFTLTILWSPFLVRSIDADPKGRSFGSAMNLYLDEADKAWSDKIQDFDYVIISSGQWFYRPLTFYENGQLVGSQKGGKHMADLNLYGYKKAFQTSFRTIIDHKGFKGITFLVTQSAKHFEHGDWNEGGFCNRTKLFTKEQRHSYYFGDILEAMHDIQVEEFRGAEKEATKKGLQFGLIDISDAMSMRPDAHPGEYGNSYNRDVKVTDCVHWCLPGPVDTWNEFLLYMMKLERDKKLKSSSYTR